MNPFTKPPHGRAEVEEFYGWNPRVYLADGHVTEAWARDKLVKLTLPSPMRYLGQPVASMRVHKRVVEIFGAAYEEIYRASLWHVVVPYAGAYEFRLIRGGAALSMHAFGAAVDHDPERNKLGKPPEECHFGNSSEGQEVVRIFERHGFMWGGRFSGRKDCMHFQFATGY